MQWLTVLKVRNTRVAVVLAYNAEMRLDITRIGVSHMALQSLPGQTSKVGSLQWKSASLWVWVSQRLVESMDKSDICNDGYYNRTSDTNPKQRSRPPKNAILLSTMRYFSWWAQKKVPPTLWSGCLWTGVRSWLLTSEFPNPSTVMTSTYQQCSHLDLATRSWYVHYPRLKPSPLPNITKTLDIKISCKITISFSFTS
jgi:hypothetical protein